MEQVIRLTGARVALTADRATRIDLVVQRGRLAPFDMCGKSGTHFDLSGHLILPGLINAHDHLEFNLFPRLGIGPWCNASDWASDIYQPKKSPVREHLLVPKQIRYMWGGVKNLLCGVTTVAHHNACAAALFSARFPVRVVRRFGWAHSLAFSQDIPDRYRRTPARWPFILHVAEGIDQRARLEIPQLDKLGVISRRTILVHAVGISSRELETIRKRGASIAWCPSSNIFTLGRTLRPETLCSGVPIALGTDSAMTAEGDLIDEMRVAREAGGLAGSQVYKLVTTNAARALRLNDGQGTIAEHGVADLLVVRDNGQTPAEALTNLRPELVMIAGRVMLASDRLAKDGVPGMRGLHSLEVEGRGRCFVRANIPKLYDAAVRTIGPEVRLAGKRVFQ